MVRLARDLWPTGRARQGARRARRTDRPRACWDAIAAEHPPADDLLDFCRAENARIEAFCREQDLIGLTDEPIFSSSAPSRIASIILRLEPVEFGGRFRRRSTSIHASSAIAFTAVPPPIFPTLYVVRGVPGTSIEANRAIIRPMACAALGRPKLP